MTDDAPQPKRLGRPPKAEHLRRRSQLTFRIRHDLRAQIQAAADASGRSLSEEVEQRLEAGFKQDPANRSRAVRDLLGGLARFLESEDAGGLS